MTESTPSLVYKNNLLLCSILPSILSTGQRQFLEPVNQGSNGLCA